MNSKLRTIIFSMILVLAASALVSAENEYQVGTRGEGIGFAFSALANEPFGALYNPAGAAFVQGLQAQAGYQIPTDYGVSSIDESPYGLMFGLNYNSPEMGVFSLNTHQYGSFSDPTEISTTTSMNLSYARPFSQQLGLGISMKYVFETNQQERKAFDFDLGMIYNPMPQLSLAAVLENVLRSKFDSDLVESHLTRKVRLAAGYHMRFDQHIGSFLLGTQMAQDESDDFKFTNLTNIGTEWWLGAYSDISLGLRTGYTFGKTRSFPLTEADYSGWSAGFSLNFDMHGNDFRIDYALRSYPYENDETLAADHMISFSYGWGGIPDYFSGVETKPDDKYDLTKYQQTQDWQTPATVEELREEPVVVESEPVVNEPAILMPLSEADPKPVVLPLTEAPIEETPTPEATPLPQTEPVVETPWLVMQEDISIQPESEPVIESVVEVPAMEQETPGELPVLESEPAPLLAQIPDEPEPMVETSTPAPIAEPIQLTPPEPVEFGKLAILLDANQLGTGKTMFTLRPNGILHLASWKLYVFAHKVKEWHEGVTDEYALAIMGAKGVTPLTVIWDGTLARGGKVQKGKYYFIVIGTDKDGNKYQTKWHKFKIH